MSFLRTKKPFFDKNNMIKRQNQGLLKPVLKYANFSSIVKCRFYGLKSLLLTKQYDQTTKPRSLVQKSRLDRYLEVITRIMG